MDTNLLIRGVWYFINQGNGDCASGHY